MVKSMTGYGKANFENDKFSVSIEIKSLNSKFLDASLRLPKAFSDKEVEIRGLLSNVLQRGKISLSLDFARKEQNTSKAAIDTSLLRSYYVDLKKSADELGASGHDLFRIALHMPDVIMNETPDMHSEEEWSQSLQCLETAIKNCDAFRIEEGRMLALNIMQNINKIDECIGKIESLEPRRISALKNRIKSQLQEILEKGQFDENRFEQELIYYIEKLDINEEKVRLKSHLNFFSQTINLAESQGKKLGFISQEIGREINTIGSKASDAEIQRLVVDMKEELEKVEEQLNNLL